MAKGIGLIGNFKGKVGNMVGYQLSDSNTGNTQGIRVYQPNVKNPKTAAQAEQRAKLAPINATYRALKSIIDRGNEGLPYGNKSRLAWLKQAFGATAMPWYVKGAQVAMPVGCQLTKGSLGTLTFSLDSGNFEVDCEGVTLETVMNTVGAVTIVILSAYPALKDGDQVTFVGVKSQNGVLSTLVKSIVLDRTSTQVVSGFAPGSDEITLDGFANVKAAAIITSRQGDNGEHLRSTSTLVIDRTLTAAAPYDATSKTAAIQSYMASDSVNSDWPEESVQ